MDRMAILNCYGECLSLSDDPLNYKRKRNSETELIGAYNCGGYALETYNWFLPFFCRIYDGYVWKIICAEKHWEYDEDRLENGNTEGEIIYQDYLEEVIELLVEEILDNNKDYNDVEDEDDAERIAYDIYYSGDYSAPAAISLTIKLILSAFPDLRLISNFSEVKENEIGIAYAAGDGDFHFIKYENGKLTHKMGCNQIEEIEDLYECFYNAGYGSEVFFFAKKKQ